MSEAPVSTYDVAIIGGGPAGLVAARYCLHGHLATALVTPELGGKVNYPFVIRGMEAVDSVWGAQLIHECETVVAGAPEVNHLREHATQLVRLPDGGFQIKLAGNTTIQASTVIIATGAAAQRLYVAGEKEYSGRGVSFSAVSHAHYFKDRMVAVVGGSQRTLVAALELAEIARHVYLILARPQAMEELPAAPLLRRLRNVTPFIGWEVQQIYGDDFVSGMSLVGTNGETRQLAVDGVFIQFGLIPNNELVRDLLELDEGGYIPINHHCETRMPGLFAAGDVTNIQSEQVLVAVGEGAKAALSAWTYLVTQS
jgi:thioredoxin reductase